MHVDVLWSSKLIMEARAMSVYDEVDERFYANVRFGILVIREAREVETFRYGSEEARIDAMRHVCSDIETSDDPVDTDVAIIRNGELSHYGTWDGEDWVLRDTALFASRYR